MNKKKLINYKKKKKKKIKKKLKKNIQWKEIKL